MFGWLVGWCVGWGLWAGSEGLGRLCSLLIFLFYLSKNGVYQPQKGKTDRPTGVGDGDEVAEVALRGGHDVDGDDAEAVALLSLLLLGWACGGSFGGWRGGKGGYDAEAAMALLLLLGWACGGGVGWWVGWLIGGVFILSTHARTHPPTYLDVLLLQHHPPLLKNQHQNQIIIKSEFTPAPTGTHPPTHLYVLLLHVHAPGAAQQLGLAEDVVALGQQRHGVAPLAQVVQLVVGGLGGCGGW